VVREVETGADATELVVDCWVLFRVSVTAAAVRDLALSVGTQVALLMKARAIHLLD